MSSTRIWSTSAFTSPAASEPTALIILNTPLVHDRLFTQIWANSTLKYCADGGANRLYDSYAESSRSAEFIPDLILGDLDSLRPEVREYYASKGVKIVQDPSQDSTDLGKCTAYLDTHERAQHSAVSGGSDDVVKRYQLVIMGGLSGRLDQTIHTLHAITRLRLGENAREGTWVVGRESIACVLGPGTHHLDIPLDDFGTTCAVLPVGEEARVTTKGLRWNLTKESWPYPTSMNAGVSTSNHLTGQIVELTTDVPIIWTAEVRGGAE